MRDLTREIEIGGEKYRVRKMDVISGTCLLKLLTQKLLPIFAQMEDLFSDDKPAAGKKRGTTKHQKSGEDAFLSLIPRLLDEITEDDLHSLIVKCLNYADKSLPAGWQPIMVREEYGVKDIQYDMTTCLVLCYHCVAFNCEGFFGDGGSIFQTISQTTKSPTLKTLTSNAMHP